MQKYVTRWAEAVPQVSEGPRFTPRPGMRPEQLRTEAGLGRDRGGGVLPIRPRLLRGRWALSAAHPEAGMLPPSLPDRSRRGAARGALPEMCWSVWGKRQLAPGSKTS